MKILMTGSSSFTGFWFASSLAGKGHNLTLTFTRDKDTYSGLRAERIRRLCELPHVQCIWNYSFGTAEFMELLGEKFDVVCHHGAYVEDYKSPAFNITHAVTENTRDCDKFILQAKKTGVKKLLLTGSVFEANEGTGSLPLVAFSPYGLSKTFTWEIFRYWAWKHDFPVAKFVIPNPFGPYEEPRFCNYLVQNWAKGIVPSVKTPDYIRDNIHVDLLASCYVAAAEQETKNSITFNPSGYVGSQKEFTLKFAKEIGSRLGFKTNVEFAVQQEFDEPVSRANTQSAVESHKDWNESGAWDRLASYYEQMLGRNK
jgi:UDP-glucose 4-epimerase